ASGTASFVWTDVAGTRQETAVVYRFSPFKLPAARETAFGAPVTLTVPLDTSVLARATHNFADIADGYALTHMAFTDKFGYVVQGANLQPFDVQVPILVK
ncbi:MAG TPA: hypothetical protein V6D47_10665, partial [Oscillatoriaceae cyanobacterium]